MGWSEEDLADLFENDFPRIDPTEFDELRVESLRLDEAVRLGQSPEEPRCEWVFGVQVVDLFDREQYPIVTYKGCQAFDRLVTRTMRDALFPDYRAQYEGAARQLVPVPGIARRIEKVVENFADDTIGVHIRRGDAVLSRAHGWKFRRSSDAAFLGAIDRELQSNPDVRFFLATDSEETQEVFCRRYGRAIVTNTEKEFVSSLPGQPKANQRDAVIDMMVLARTKRILGTYYSSFSKFAALIGGIGWEAIVEQQ